MYHTIMVNLGQGWRFSNCNRSNPKREGRNCGNWKKRREYFSQSIYLKSKQRSKKSKYEEFRNNSLTDNEVKPTVCCSRGTLKKCFSSEGQHYELKFGSKDWFVAIMWKKNIFTQVLLNPLQTISTYSYPSWLLGWSVLLEKERWGSKDVLLFHSGSFLRFCVEIRQRWLLSNHWHLNLKTRQAQRNDNEVWREEKEHQL